MIRLGLILILAGVLTILLPLGGNTSLAGLIIVGLGCAPVYPCVIHSTPERFGAGRAENKKTPGAQSRAPGVSAFFSSRRR